MANAATERLDAGSDRAPPRSARRCFPREPRRDPVVPAAVATTPAATSSASATTASASATTSSATASAQPSAAASAPSATTSAQASTSSASPQPPACTAAAGTAAPARNRSDGADNHRHDSDDFAPRHDRRRRNVDDGWIDGRVDRRNKQRAGLSELGSDGRHSGRARRSDVGCRRRGRRLGRAVRARGRELPAGTVRGLSTTKPCARLPDRGTPRSAERRNDADLPAHEAGRSPRDDRSSFSLVQADRRFHGSGARGREPHSLPRPVSRTCSPRRRLPIGRSRSGRRARRCGRSDRDRTGRGLAGRGRYCS